MSARPEQLRQLTETLVLPPRPERWSSETEALAYFRRLTSDQLREIAQEYTRAGE